MPPLRAEKVPAAGISPRIGRKHKVFHPNRDARLGTPAWGRNPRIAWILISSGACEAGDTPPVETSAARSAGSLILLDADLGFRFASPEALCCRPLRRLEHHS